MLAPPGAQQFSPNRCATSGLLVWVSSRVHYSARYPPLGNLALEAGQQGFLHRVYKRGGV